MNKLQTAMIAGLTSRERAYIRRELDQFFSTLPTVANDFQLKTWRGGSQAGKPKLPLPATGLLERGLMQLDASQRWPRLLFTESGLAALRTLMMDPRLADPAPTSVRNSASTRSRRRRREAGRVVKLEAAGLIVPPAACLVPTPDELATVCAHGADVPAFQNRSRRKRERICPANPQSSVKPACAGPQYVPVYVPDVPIFVPALVPAVSAAPARQFWRCTGAPSHESQYPGDDEDPCRSDAISEAGREWMMLLPL